MNEQEYNAFMDCLIQARLFDYEAQDRNGRFYFSFDRKTANNYCPVFR